MTITGSSTISALFKEIDTPIFTQRETADLSGVDVATISNWLKPTRQLLTLHPVNGRPQSGRRLFSKLQVLILKLAAAQMAVGIGPSDALLNAGLAIKDLIGAYREGKVLFHVPNRGMDFSIWLVLTGLKLRPGDESESGIRWAYDVALSPIGMLMLSEMNGKAFELDGDFREVALICLPLGQLVYQLATSIAELLSTDGGSDSE